MLGAAQAVLTIRVHNLATAAPSCNLQNRLDHNLNIKIDTKFESENFDYLESIWYRSKPSEVPYFTNKKIVLQEYSRALFWLDIIF